VSQYPVLYIPLSQKKENFDPNSTTGTPNTFLYVRLYNLEESYFWRNVLPQFYYILQKEAESSSETSINFYQNLGTHIQEEYGLQSQPFRPPIITKQITLFSTPTSKHTRYVTFVIGLHFK
jgi:hypothetical protein